MQTGEAGGDATVLYNYEVVGHALVLLTKPVSTSSHMCDTSQAEGGRMGYH